MPHVGHKRGGYHGGHRPKLDPAVRRDVQLNVAVTHHDSDVLHKLADEQGIAVSALVYQLVCHAIGHTDGAGHGGHDVANGSTDPSGMALG